MSHGIILALRMHRMTFSPILSTIIKYGTFSPNKTRKKSGKIRCGLYFFQFSRNKIVFNYSVSVFLCDHNFCLVSRFYSVILCFFIIKILIVN